MGLGILSSKLKQTTKKVDDAFIIETNRKCYDNLGADYTDGEGDLETLLKIGSWQEFVDILPGKKVLDVGCGAGDIAKWFAEHDYQVAACDLSAEMVDVAKKKAPSAEIFALGATELDKLAGRKFDGITSVHLVQHLSKSMMKKFFGDVYELLSDNGKFFLAFTNTCYEKTGYQLDGEKENNYIFWHKWGMEDVIPLLSKAKLKPVAVHIQKGADIEGGCAVNMEPFVFICEKECI